ncbi:unnamed protein product [Wuchereria bancrofti]|uniref:Uncharacterized protein n=1 Tax=Wuchereria bancrofti TaxID=6293 RepID=A0A3P7DG72_WUCBA|nr:unnamed protein product [Wuchereria bancrofti]
MPLVDVPGAKIDPDGVFKYILIKVIEKATKKEKLIVRGYARCAYHGDVLGETEKELGTDYELLCLGGGRIKHESKDHSILVYGYSQGYGPADHQKSVTAKSTSEEKMIIRGYKHCQWHKNIFKQTEKEIGTSFSLKCVGGGRIMHEPQKKSLFVYGYSQRYGPAKHEQTVNLLQKKYPEYKITYSYEGY